jgi:cytochrome c biogenesis protein CcdA
MGLFILRAGPNGPRNSFSFLCGAFIVETLIVVFASVFLSNTVEPDSGVDNVFLGIRLVLGVVLIVYSFRLRRQPSEEEPEVPKALQKLQNVGPKASFVAGFALADYVGPALASTAIATSDVSTGGSVVAVLIYTVLGTGIPGALLLLSIKKKSVADKVDEAMSWTMKNRREVVSWIALILGIFVAGDALTNLLVVNG